MRKIAPKISYFVNTTHMDQLTIKGDAATLDRIRALVAGWEGVIVDTANEQISRMGKLSIRPGDPSIDISDLPGIWADRDDLTLDTSVNA